MDYWDVIGEEDRDEYEDRGDGEDGVVDRE